MITGHSIVVIGGRDVAVSCKSGPRFTRDVTSLADYLGRVGVRHFAASEIAMPLGDSRRAKMRQCGYDDLIPPVTWWPRLALLLLIADRCRMVCGSPVMVRWAWRPEELNALVGGAQYSDHITCHAIDLEFRSRGDRAKVQSSVLEHLWSLSLFDISLGIGWRIAHVGAFSPRGHRRWKY